jgi:hypothetical protein
MSSFGDYILLTAERSVENLARQDRREAVDINHFRLVISKQQF